MTAFRCIALALVAMCATLAQAPAWAQGIRTSDATATSTGTGSSTAVQSIAVDLRIGGSVQISTGTVFTVQFCDGTGTPVGKPISVATNPKGLPNQGARLTIDIPASDSLQSLGNCATISYPDDPAIKVTLKWASVNAKGKVSVVVVPGRAGEGPQRWDLEFPPGDPANPDDVVIDGTPTGVIASGFDVTYVPLGGNLFRLDIAGDNSYLRLTDGSLIFFPAGSPFGTLQIDPGLNGGTFDFVAIGVSGLWGYDPLTNVSRGTVLAQTAFVAPALRVLPEPVGVWLLALSCGSALLGMRRRTRCKHSA